MMEANLLDCVLNLYHQNQWKNILGLGEKLSYIETRKLLWVWPSENNLNFIKTVVINFKLKGIISIGCGCGLLEWIINQSTGLVVIGYEINEEWWKSKYCNPQFIELKFPVLPPTTHTLDSKYALLFCYFNDGSAFKDYVSCYKGNLILIIGPGEGAGRHTNPEPFRPEFGCSDWILHQFEEVPITKDFIAAYVRSGDININSLSNGN